MSKTGIKLSIDVTKIDKALLYKGAKGTYLNCSVFVTDAADQYGNNGMITQEVSKEARDAGEQGPILGNCKVFWREESAPQRTAPQQRQPAKQPAERDMIDDDIPFN